MLSSGLCPGPALLGQPGTAWLLAAWVGTEPQPCSLGGLMGAARLCAPPLYEGRSAPGLGQPLDLDAAGNIFGLFFFFPSSCKVS